MGAAGSNSADAGALELAPSVAGGKHWVLRTYARVRAFVCLASTPAARVLTTL
jgi:hypothetical protein